jgi:hypothetical protein
MWHDLAKILAWPLGFVILMFPLRKFLDPLLQAFTYWFVAGGLTLVRVPFDLGDYELVLPSKIWAVTVYCGGWRFLIPGLALAWTLAL